MLHSSFLRRRPQAALIVALLGLLLGVLLGGCETSVSLGKKIDYKSATTTPPLEIPPDLSTPTYDDRYLATTASGAAAARAAGKASDILPLNPDAHLARAGSERWLVVKATPEAAWTTLSEFWPANGFVLAVQQPSLGIMETDWAENRAAAPRSWLGEFFDKYVDLLTDTYRRDKFRSRIEPGTETGTVEIYITHYGAVQVPTKPDSRLTKYGDDFQWTPTPPDPELEAEFLSKLMLKFGSSPPAAASAVAELPKQPARARIEKAGDGASRLVVDDSFDRAWRRVGLALDRTGFTVVDRDRSKGLYFVRYSNPDLDASKTKGILDKLAFWKSDDKDKPEQYRVVVTQADPASVVTVEDPQGATDRSENGDKILALLQDQLK